MEHIRVALVQMKSSPDPEANLVKALARVGEAARKGARVVCLQELFLTPYFCRTESRAPFRHAQTLPGPATVALSAAAKRLGVAIIAPLFEKRARGLYHNSAAVLDADGRLAGKYRKMHIPDDPGYYEKYYFAPGDLGFDAIPTRYGRLGVLICWDQWYPEAARLSALSGADMLFYPTAIGAPVKADKRSVQTMKSAWRTVQISHAVTNGIWVACVNRVGREGNTHFWGSSFVVAPDGRVVAEASADREEVLYADCDLGRIADTREEWPFLRDRRIDAYRGLLKRFSDAAV